MTDVQLNDLGEETDIPFHCGNQCPGGPLERDYTTDVFPCGYRHWCPWCGDCEYCYGRGPHDWD